METTPLTESLVASIVALSGTSEGLTELRQQLKHHMLTVSGNIQSALDALGQLDFSKHSLGALFLMYATQVYVQYRVVTLV